MLYLCLLLTEDVMLIECKEVSEVVGIYVLVIIVLQPNVSESVYMVMEAEKLETF